MAMNNENTYFLFPWMTIFQPLMFHLPSLFRAQLAVAHQFVHLHPPELRRET